MVWSLRSKLCSYCFFFQAEDGIRDSSVTGVKTCALPISYAVFCLRMESRSSKLCSHFYHLLVSVLRADLLGSLSYVRARFLLPPITAATVYLVRIAPPL